MSELQLEVGKTYVDRDGDEHKIVLCETGAGFPFKDDWGCSYTWNGSYYGDGDEDKLDLVREVDDTAEAVPVPSKSGTDIRRELLAVVESCVCRDRQGTYGDAEDNFDDIAKLASVVLAPKLNADLSPEDVALFSMCIKLARLKVSPEHGDNWIDLAGYAVCGGGIMKRKDSIVEV